MSSPEETKQDEIADTESGLNRLVDRGYQFVHPRNAEGEVVAVVGIRVHDNVIDVVRLHAEDDVHATRMPGDERDILAPKKVYWQSSGTARQVLTELLALPEDHVPGSVLRTDEQVSGCWVTGDDARSKWLAAS